jgi:ATP sulfurylase
VGKLVEVLAGVSRVGDYKAKVKVEALEELFPEEMPLNHAKVVHSLVADAKLDPEG